MALIENSSRCPTNEDGEKVAGGGLPWVVDFVEKVGVPWVAGGGGPWVAGGGLPWVVDLVEKVDGGCRVAGGLRGARGLATDGPGGV